jgi:hypothetical protein
MQTSRLGRPPLGCVSSVSITRPDAIKDASLCVTVTRERPEADSNDDRDIGPEAAINARRSPLNDCCGRSVLFISQTFMP